MGRVLSIEAELIPLAEFKPTAADADLFGSVLAVSMIKDGEDFMFSELSPHQIEQIGESGNFHHWMWLKVNPEELKAIYAKSLDRA